MAIAGAETAKFLTSNAEQAQSFSASTPKRVLLADSAKLLLLPGGLSARAKIVGKEAEAFSPKPPVGSTDGSKDEESAYEEDLNDID